MLNKIELTKTVPPERWGEFFDQFSDGNRGRHISIEVITDEFGDEELVSVHGGVKCLKSLPHIDFG